MSTVPKQRSIPGWAYMIAGLLVMGYTRFIQSKQPSTKIGLFFWIGVIFLVIGILKETVPRMLSKKPKKELVGPPHAAPTDVHNHLQNAQHHISPHMTHQHTQPAMHPSHPYQPAHKQCPRCHTATHGQSKFCHNCGHQFF